MIRSAISLTLLLVIGNEGLFGQELHFAEMGDCHLDTTMGRSSRIAPLATGLSARSTRTEQTLSFSLPGSEVTARRSWGYLDQRG